MKLRLIWIQKVDLLFDLRLLFSILFRRRLGVWGRRCRGWGRAEATSEWWS
jgi:hypothetical protein